MPTNYFDERIASSYREKWPHLFEPGFVEPTVSLLAELAGTGAALELGIGTGRIAIPLRRRGMRALHQLEQEPRLGMGKDTGRVLTRTAPGPLRLSWLLRAPWLIGCIPVTAMSLRIRVNRENNWGKR